MTSPPTSSGLPRRSSAHGDGDGSLTAWPISALTPEDVKTERKVILEERRSRVDNDPVSILQDRSSPGSTATTPTAFPSSRLGARDWKGADPEDAFAFYHRFYAPENAILVVAGDVEPDEAVRALAEQASG